MSLLSVFFGGNIWGHLYITACLKGQVLCCLHSSLYMGHMKGRFGVFYSLLSSMGNSFIIEQPIVISICKIKNWSQSP